MKKGFTLIELLAVIVVLAILALVVTPIVLNIVENAQTGSDERSLEQYAKVMQTAFYENQMNDTSLTLEDFLSRVDTVSGVSLTYNGSRVECSEKVAVETDNGEQTIELYNCTVDGRGTYEFVNGKAKKIEGKSIFTITNNLTNVTSSNNEISIRNGKSYSAIITPNENYEIESILILMGEEDITSTSYDNGVITIEKVTGDIVINVIAARNEDELLNEGVIEWQTGYTTDSNSGAIKEGSRVVSNQIMMGQDFSFSILSLNFVVSCYDENGVFLGQLAASRKELASKNTVNWFAATNVITSEMILTAAPTTAYIIVVGYSAVIPEYEYLIGSIKEVTKDTLEWQLHKQIMSATGEVNNGSRAFVVDPIFTQYNFSISVKSSKFLIACYSETDEYLGQLNIAKTALVVGSGQWFDAETMVTRDEILAVNSSIAYIRVSAFDNALPIYSFNIEDIDEG